MNIYQFMSDSPFVTIILGFTIATIIGGVLKFFFLLINRPLRHMNIRKHGWPPQHCDADGDFKEKEPKE